MKKKQYFAALTFTLILAILIGAQIYNPEQTQREQTQREQTQREQTQREQTNNQERETAVAADTNTNTVENHPTQATKPTNTSDEPAQNPPPNLGSKPALTNLEGWLQTDKTSLEDFSNDIRIVQFWTFGCQDCKNALPALQETYATWQNNGVEIIGIHAPEFPYERDTEAIQQAAKDLGITWPIALDTEEDNFHAWQGKRRFWPRTYILDKNGNVRFDKIGSSAPSSPEFHETLEYLVQNGS